VNKKERGLGKGLGALLSSEYNLGSEGEVLEVAINKISPRQDQPRKSFKEESLQEMAESIKEHGIIQPIIIRSANEGYEIIAGERRWRAAIFLGLDTVPAVVKEMDDQRADEVALTENIQRDDLTVVEEARAYKHMIDKYGYTQEMMGQKIGKSRVHVSNTMRILNLPEEILAQIEAGFLSAGHARTLLSLNPAEQLKMVAQITKGGLSVRQTEELVKNKQGVKKLKPLEISELEDKLQKQMGTKVEIISKKKGGKIEISYFDDQDLERILEIIGV
jgi:ParB family chromosome partitioning protein